jgi:hypothetical protein
VACIQHPHTDCGQNGHLYKRVSKWYVIKMIKDEIDRICSTHGVKGNAYVILLGKHEGKKPLG